MGKLKKFIKDNRDSVKRVLCIILILFVAFSIVTVWGNVTLSIEHFTIETDKLNIKNGYKIAHISDYHNTHNSNLNSELMASLVAEKPDIIVLTGDLIDYRRTDVDKSLEFVSQIIKIAPIYYVTGNHECNVSIENQAEFDDMMLNLKSLDVEILRGDNAVVALPQKQRLVLWGIDDPRFHGSYPSTATDITDSLCSSLDVDKNEYNILLAHHPEQLDIYSKYNFDLVYSGHAHGGQARLFGLGFIAPDQGLFPVYTSGLYKKNGTTLVVSRGIGNSVVPIRFFDRPHLIYTVIE